MKIDIRTGDGPITEIQFGDEESQYVELDTSLTPIVMPEQQCDLDIEDAENLILALKKAIEVVKGRS